MITQNQLTKYAIHESGCRYRKLRTLVGFGSAHLKQKTFVFERALYS